MESWISRLYEDEQMLRMGHHQRRADLNLGLGWVYYGMARVIRPRTVVVIGSWRGFAPMVFGKALMDNQDGGRVVFVDPSMADDFWKDPAKVQAHFAAHGVTNIEHHLDTTQQFMTTATYRDLGPVGLIFVDGMHTREQARIDHEAFAPFLTDDGVILFHDSKEMASSPIYGPGREYIRDVCLYMDELRTRPDLEVFNLPYDQGVTLVRKASRP